MSGNGTLVGSNIVKHDVNLIILCNLPNVLCNIYWRNFDFINISNENSDKMIFNTLNYFNFLFSY